MLEAKEYTFSELMQVIKESSDTKKPVVGTNVWKDNSQNNVKAVKDIMKQTEEYNKVGDKKRSTNPENITDYNKTTLDVDFSYEPSKEYKDRVKAQAHGFPSVENEKNSKIKEENEGLDYEGNKDFYDANAKKTKEVSKRKADVKHAGLKSHNLPIEEFKDNNLFTNENKKMKRLTYNKTFLNEAHVLKKVPDDYKVDGNKFIMRDAEGTEYMIECKKDSVVDYVYTNVVKITNTDRLNEQFNRMKELVDYKSSDYQGRTTAKSRKIEENTFIENLAKVKKLNETK